MNRDPKKHPEKYPERRTESEKPSDSGRGYTSNSTLFCCAAIALLILANFKIFSNIITENPDVVTEYITENVQPETEEPTEEEKKIKRELETDFEKITVTYDDTKRGSLILVNNDTAYSFDVSTTAVKDEEFVAFVQHLTGNYVVSYPAKEFLTESAMDAFVSMTDDFAALTGRKDLFILDSSRSYEDQQRVFNEKGPTIATVPGHSEHHTGLAYDLELYRNGRGEDFHATGDYAWIADNCHKYGYVLRYPESKTPVTGISYEPWHYRYVSEGHAYYMMKNNLCLEEYIKLLSNHLLDVKRLVFTDDNGDEYMVYSQKVEEGGGEIYVPKNREYTLSGDNCGNIIVTCCTKAAEE